MSRRAKDGKSEFDFETDATDIRLPSLQIEELKKGLRNNSTIRFEQNVPEMHYGLRVREYVACVTVDQQLTIIPALVKEEMIISHYCYYF